MTDQSPNYSPDNWAHKALLLMDEAEWLIRFGAVNAPEDLYTPAAKAFWAVCHMLADERQRLHEVTPAPATANFPSGSMGEYVEGE